MRSIPHQSAAAVFLFVALGALAPAGVAGQEEGIAVGATPTDASLEELDGAPVSLDAVVSGKPALVEFWATWCPICRALEPRVRAAHERFGEEVTFVVVAVGVAQTRQQVAAHQERHDLPGRVLWDARGEAVRAYDAPGTGFVVVLDRDGRVAYTGMGVDQDLEAALGRVAAPEDRAPDR